MLIKMIQFLLALGYILGIPLSIALAYLKLGPTGSPGQFFHEAVYYWPAIGLLSLISGEIKLLQKITRGIISIPARALNLAHWLLLMALNIGVWQSGGASISWATLKLVLIAIIGWQVGLGIKKRWHLATEEKVAGSIALVACAVGGFVIGYVRNLDQQPFGWGWALESVTAFIATVMVWRWVTADIRMIKVRAKDYSHGYFWNGMYSNALILVFTIHQILRDGGFTAKVLLHDNALALNALIGNVLFWWFYGTYEYYRRGQDKIKATS